MQSAQDFIDGFAAELGEDVAKMTGPQSLLRWVNRAQSRLGIYVPKVQTITWANGFYMPTLPSDMHHPEDLRGTNIPPFEWFGNALVFSERDNVTGGSAALYYWANFPKITGEQDSLLPDEGDDACLSYCLYRFFKRLASSRADYRQYATITAQNGVDISELDALSERHFNDFDDARRDLQETAHAPSQFFAG